MTTEQLITEIETKIQETQLLINNHRNELTNKENMLQSFIKQLSQIKENMKLENNENNTFSGANNK